MHIELNISQSTTIRDIIQRLEEAASDISQIKWDLDGQDQELCNDNPDTWPGTIDQDAVQRSVNLLTSVTCKLEEAIENLSTVTEIL